MLSKLVEDPRREDIVGPIIEGQRDQRPVAGPATDYLTREHRHEVGNLEAAVLSLGPFVRR
ncbi:MAG TPA: hypothetical protein VIL95_05580 [Bacillota bacterium]